MILPPPILAHARPALSAGLAALLAVVVLLAAPRQLPAQVLGPAEQQEQRYSLALRIACLEVVKSANRSTVLIRCDAKDAVLGAIVEPDGWIVTKASELSGRITCRLKPGLELPARLVGVAEDHDLALLKVDAADLIPVSWADPNSLVVGQFLATTAATDIPLAVGVVSVGRRKLPSHSVMLGVALEDGPGGVRVMQVVPDSGAENAGIRVDDVILSLAGRTTPTRRHLINAIQSHHIGDQVKITLKRAGKEIEIAATLGARPPATAPTRSEFMNTLGGPLSKRSSGFPAVFQHDTVLKPSDCGGPLVNLDGKVVGINIARAGRTESYALPADVVLSLLDDLKSGKLLPPTATRPASTRPRPARRSLRRRLRPYPRLKRQNHTTHGDDPWPFVGRPEHRHSDPDVRRQHHQPERDEAHRVVSDQPLMPPHIP
jgi:serine protease Do